jgi:hypothetical protein
LNGYAEEWLWVAASGSRYMREAQGEAKEALHSKTATFDDHFN